MADNVYLDSDEVILAMNERVQYGSVHSGYANTLILTNKSIVLVKKGLFGTTKDTIRFPLQDIKIYNEVPQASVRRASSGFPVLDVFFKTNQESFGFERKKDAIIWVEKITEVLMGKKETPNTNAFHALPGTELIAKTLKGTIDTYRDTFGLTKKEKIVSCTCSACGASVKGKKGDTIQCPYCRTFISL